MSCKIVEVARLDAPELDPYCRLTDTRLRHEAGLFVAESPKVIMSALEAGMKPVSMLCERKHIVGDAAPILQRCPDITVYTGERELLRSLTGYTLTRGVLCAFERPVLPSVEEICRDARRLAVIDGVCDTTNIGAIFRSAVALGVEGVLLTPESCDPLNRRAVRVSMGTVFKVPWTWLNGKLSDIRQWGLKTVALALSDDSVPIDDPQLNGEPRLAMVLGTEGDGLAHKVIAEADYVARIPMQAGVDSLNVAAASAVAFWQLRGEKGN